MNVAQIEKGIMNVYIFLKNEKKYLIYYKNDLKECLAIFIYDLKPFQTYIGFWNEGKVDGLC